MVLIHRGIEEEMVKTVCFRHTGKEEIPVLVLKEVVNRFFSNLEASKKVAHKFLFVFSRPFSLNIDHIIDRIEIGVG